MQEMKEDMWKVYTDIHCVTTNGDINNRKEAVMGRGCARQAKDLFPGISKVLYQKLMENGNHVNDLGYWEKPPEGYEFHIVSFPVKHHWDEISDIQLIERSAVELRVMADMKDWGSVLLPRPGCGNGKLSWDKVRMIIEPILDNRFTIISPKEDK